MAQALDIASGVGSGLNSTMGNLLQMARDERNRPALEAQTSILQDQAKVSKAITDNTLMDAEREKERQQKLDKSMPIEKVMESHPLIKDFMQHYSSIAGWDKDKTEITPREMQETLKYYSEKPQEAMTVVSKFKDGMVEQTRNYNEKLQGLQDKLKDLKPGPDNEKIQKLQEDIQKTQKEMAPLLQNRQQADMMYRQLKKQQGLMMLGDKNITDNQLYALAESGDVDPEVKKLANNILQRKQDEKVKQAKATADAKNQGHTPFGQWSKYQKEWWFKNRKETGELPPFAWGDKDSRTQFSQEYADWAKNQGISGAEAKTDAETFKALSKSLANQERSRGMMGGFVNNLNQQIDRVNEIYKDIQRIGIRGLDKPLRELKVRAAGSGQERVIEAYLTEISNEIAKLSTGSQASIAELSVGAQDRWNKIHDPNLSLKELVKILDETKQMASMRIKSADKEIESTKQRMKKGNTSATATGYSYQVVE